MFTRNLLDQPFFSGMKIESNKGDEAEDNSGVSTVLSLFISNHNSKNHKRKLEGDRVSTQLTLSCSKKLKTAESKNDYTNSAVPSTTRNLLDSFNKPGIEIEPYEKEEISRVSTELSLSISNQIPENLELDEKKITVGRLVDETAGLNDARVSTELKLFDETWVTSNSTSQVAVVLDPWKVKKKLRASDLCRIQMRLLVPSGVVKEHILPLIGATEEQIDNGIDVRVWDCDTSTLHRLKFQRWISSNSYVLKGKWIMEFVKRRKLKEKDTIGLYWNVAESRFHFCVLEKAAAELV